MSYVRQKTLPVEPVLLAEMKNFLKVPANVTQDDALISQLTTAAREYAEVFTGLCIAQRDFVQALDSFPYYVDTIMSQQAYPPNYYSNPRYSTTLWNYSQMMKLYYPPLTDVESIQYIDGSGQASNGELQTLHEGVDFIVDYLAFEARIFPLAGSFWPSVLYVPNAVLINYTAGFDPDPTKTKTVNVTVGSPPDQQPTYEFVIGIPMALKTAIMMIVAHWYFNREPVVAGTAGTVPMHVDSMLWSWRVEDVSPTRG